MIDCHKCKHYYVTWDKNFPHGCKAMGFKSKQIPSIQVRVISQRECLLVSKKNTGKTKKS
ncbi:MAG: uracil-DNA glycosylase [Deltaproteobacteria bacterium]|nr:uracil-DNA glycosylase [Deltaproteobacteria bacterium]